ncbi:MAG: SAM-dependent methyltransferase, partial [Synergistaceae bacterium]
MIYVVGLGPGKRDQMTQRALLALEKCDVIIGYKGYIDLIKDDFLGRKEL